jgi:hypothetical protein
MISIKEEIEYVNSQIEKALSLVKEEHTDLINLQHEVMTAELNLFKERLRALRLMSKKKELNFAYYLRTGNFLP